MATRNDPFHGFRFRVECEGIQRAGFTKVKGLVRETKVETRREGGLNEFEHKFATNTTYNNLVLERGLADDNFWRWHTDVIEERPGSKRRSLTITLFNDAGDEVWRWLVQDAFPVKWTGSDLDGASSQVLVESVELAHHGIHKG
jgi:phage tail-like protein